jgi:hypothetical protein
MHRIACSQPRLGAATLRHKVVNHENLMYQSLTEDLAEIGTL